MGNVPLRLTRAFWGWQEMLVNPVSNTRMIGLFIVVALCADFDLCGISSLAKIYECREEDFRGRRIVVFSKDY